MNLPPVEAAGAVAAGTITGVVVTGTVLNGATVPVTFTGVAGAEGLAPVVT